MHQASQQCANKLTQITVTLHIIGTSTMPNTLAQCYRLHLLPSRKRIVLGILWRFDRDPTIELSEGLFPVGELLVFFIGEGGSVSGVPDLSLYP